MKTTLIFATKRSGHHAIIEWIGNNSHTGTVLHNDVAWNFFVRGELKHKGKRKEIAYGSKKVNRTIYNFEDININQHSPISKSPFVINHDKTIIVLRDVYNMIASSIKSTPKNTDSTIRKRTDRWKEYCRELLGETSWVDKDKLHFINYNTWFMDREYRDLIGQSLGFINRDNGISKISDFGGGSSFGKVSDARNMGVFDRWKNYASHSLFLKYITDEVDDLNRKIFGFNLEDLKDGYNKFDHNS